MSNGKGNDDNHPGNGHGPGKGGVEQDVTQIVHNETAQSNSVGDTKFDFDGSKLIHSDVTLYVSFEQSNENGTAVDQNVTGTVETKHGTFALSWEVVQAIWNDTKQSNEVGDTSFDFGGSKVIHSDITVVYKVDQSNENHTTVDQDVGGAVVTKDGAAHHLDQDVVQAVVNDTHQSNEVGDTTFDFGGAHLVHSDVYVVYDVDQSNSNTTYVDQGVWA